MVNRVLSCILAALLLVPAPVLAWGLKGHEMQARAAHRAVKSQMPTFFAEAAEELAFLITEPDRWRTAEQPSLTINTGVDHTFKWELAPRPLPATRHLFLIGLAKQGKLDPPHTVQEFGTGAYGIQEWSEMLTAAFRRWHAMPEGTAADARASGCTNAASSSWPACWDIG